MLAVAAGSLQVHSRFHIAESQWNMYNKTERFPLLFFLVLSYINVFITGSLIIFLKKEKRRKGSSPING